MTPSKNLLLIFTRNPELGKVKTRLAKGVGNQYALEIYKRLLQHTKKVVLPIHCDKRVGYSEAVRNDDMWEASQFQKFKQQGTDLGDRMYHAFAKAFTDGYQKVIIVGSDLYDLKQEHIDKAFLALDTHDFVIGPAQDGGYYLLGMTQLEKSIFYNKQWGGETVYQSTRDDLSPFSIYTLDTLNDIDYVEDLKGYPEFEQFIPLSKKANSSL